LIDVGGRLLRVGRRDVAIAVTKLGYIHIQAIDADPSGEAGDGRTVVVTLRPSLGSELALAALGYAISDLCPKRTIVHAEFTKPQCWVFPEYLPALKKVAALIAGSEPGPALGRAAMAGRPI
jgi:hypothetical protein